MGRVLAVKLSDLRQIAAGAGPRARRMGGGRWTPEGERMARWNCLMEKKRRRALRRWAGRIRRTSVGGR
nr:hypothetical protein CFP56_21728 [Quercus suber]